MLVNLTPPPLPQQMMAGVGAKGWGGEDNYRMVVKEASDALELAPHHAKALYRYVLICIYVK